MSVKLHSLLISQHTCLRLNPGFPENISLFYYNQLVNGHLKNIYKVIHNCLSVVYKQLVTTVSQRVSALDPWWQEGYKQPPTRQILTS